MKTKEELNALKEENQALSADELAQVTGGLDIHTITKNDIDRGGYQLSDCQSLTPAPSLPAQTLQHSTYKPDDLPEGFK